MERIPQSATLRIPLKLYLTSDHISDATGKTLAVTISKNGGAFGNPSGGATNATEIASGWYYFDASTTDTGTVGPLIVRGTCAACDNAEVAYDVVAATNGGWTALPATACTTNASLLTSGTGTAQLSVGSGLVTLAAVTHTGAVLPRVTLTDTLTTYTGNTVQTGDVYPKVDTEIATLLTAAAAIQAKTDGLPSDPADASDVAAALASLASTLATMASYIDTEVAAIKAKTDSLTFTVAGQVDANVQRLNDVTITGDGSTTPFGV